MLRHLFARRCRAPTRRDKRRYRPECLRLEDRNAPSIVPAGPDLFLDQYGTNTHVAMAADGSYLVTWQEHEGTYYFPTYGQRFTANNTALGPVFPIMPGGDEYWLDPGPAAVAVNPAGNQYVFAWSKGVAMDQREIYFNHVTALGALTGEDHGQANTTNTTAINADTDVAMFADGSFVVVWATKVGNDNYDVSARRFSAGGTALDFNEFVVANRAAMERRPVVAASPGGRFVIAWEDGSNVHFSVYSASGVRTVPEQAVSTAPLASGYARLAASMDPAGNFVLAWDTAGGRVAYQKFDALGQSLTGQLSVGGGVTPAESPSVALADDGRFVIAYDDKTNTYAAVYSAAGQEIDRSLVAANSTWASVAWHGGSFVVASNTGSWSGDVHARAFREEAPPGPVAPGVQDITSAVLVRAGRRRHLGGRYRQKVTVVNRGGQAFAGPIRLVVDGLRRKIRLMKRSGMTTAMPPMYSPYKHGAPGADNVFSPGETLTFVLDYVKPGRVPFKKYWFRVLAGPGVA
jgi:hypothetical protein